MRKGISGCLVVLCCGALLTAGCAHKEQVKPSEAVTTQQPAPAPAPAEAPKPAAPAAAAPQQTPLPETRTEEAAVRPEAPRGPEPGAVKLEAELQTIYFDFDSAALSQEARNVLSKNAQYLAKNPDVKVRIEGNCDERGSDEYNMALGERRAKSARDYLVNLGVSADRLTIISYGLEKPADPGHDDSAWAKNRRDDFVIVR